MTPTKRRPDPRGTLAAVRPNAGLAVLYQAKIDRLIDDMHASLLYWLRAAYKHNTPELAQDAEMIGMSPARALQTIMARLARRWQRQFDKAAPELGAWFTQAASDRSDRALAAILKRGGFSVRFKMTAPMNDVMQATIATQVGLIRRIAEQHLGDVQGLVMRSVTTGRDLATLTKEIEDRYGLTRRRAALIASDQNNKATATMQRVRQMGIGVTHAVWMHSHGGTTPRPTHVKAGAEKLVYEVAKGALDLGDKLVGIESAEYAGGGKYILPGEEINCKCVSRPILRSQMAKYGLFPAADA